MAGESIPGYQLIEPVGQGGFAVVYRAVNERLGREVAVKVLSVTNVDERALRNFRRELEVTAKLSHHPNVVAALDTGVTALGRPYIAMDLYEGGSLADRLRAHGGLPVQEVLRAGVKIAGALAAVHETGVFHGDVKPQNILLSRYGEPALADFGVARMLDVGQLSSNTLSFTPHHAAPEVLHGSPQSVASDVYALGSTLYQLLSGRPAFHDPGDSGVAPLVMRVINQPLPPLRRSDVPAPLRKLLERAMAKAPADRPRDARSMAVELQGLQRALGVPVTELPELLGAPETTVPYEPPKPRRPWRIAAAVATVAAVAAVTAVVLLDGSPETGGQQVRAEQPIVPTQPAGKTAEPERTTRPSPRRTKKATVQPVSLAPALHRLAPGKTVQLTPKGAGQAAVVYESSDPAVATVDANGLVTAVKPGTAVLTVRVSVAGKEQTATTAVRVTAPVTKTTKVTASAAADVQAGTYANVMYPTCAECGIKSHKQTSLNRETYLGFDLGAVKGEVVSVTLHVNARVADDSGDGAEDVHVHAVGDAWKALDVTWNSRPALGARLGTLDVVKSPRWLTLDITKYARSKHGGRMSLGFADDDYPKGLRVYVGGKTAYLTVTTR
ncbi:MAG: protein kinase [Thermoactinospora sp.]|nr:protein kinase [Thermoactinospora sp.]